mmetsp:Transcript_40335/g.61546  ORF Transcript_40335/g.61546 Transcript_40335/m.61546 type:complete len:104 (-) Transcript_40335:424-735(-)
MSDHSAQEEPDLETGANGNLGHVEAGNTGAATATANTGPPGEKISMFDCVKKVVTNVFSKKKSKDGKDSFICTICLDTITEKKKWHGFPCNHRFCKICLERHV